MTFPSIWENGWWVHSFLPFSLEDNDEDFGCLEPLEPLHAFPLSSDELFVVEQIPLGIKLEVDV